MRRVSTRNAAFQQWHALAGNRTKRQRLGEFLVQGVRPITLALSHGFDVRAMLCADGQRRSQWAQDTLAAVAAERRVAVAPELLRELGDKDEQAPELLAVVGIPADDLTRIPLAGAPLAVAFDRPANPGNLGTLIRSADAFGACGVAVTGHAADVYDPRTVRASTGSLFALPVIRAAAPRDVLAWATAAGLTVVGADETAADDAAECDLTGPTLLVVGSEARGMSAAWREACERTVRIPIATAAGASSLNAAVAASILLYEATRQRRATHS